MELEPLQTSAVTHDPTFRAPFSEETEWTCGAVILSKNIAQDYSSSIKQLVKLNVIPVKSHLITDDAVAFAPILPDDVESMNRLIRIINHVLEGVEPVTQVNEVKPHLNGATTHYEVQRQIVTEVLPQNSAIDEDVRREGIKYKWDLLNRRGDWFLLKHHTLQQASSNAQYFMKRTGKVVKCHEVSDGVLLILIDEERRV